MRPDVAVPAGVRAAAGGRSLRPVWVNEAHGLTFEAVGAGGRCFIKWVPCGSGLDLRAEADRMSWAAEFHPVPRPLDLGSDDDGTWLVTAALPGDSAVTPKWTGDPATAVTAIGEGLRALHDALPVGSCPFTWSAEWNYGPGGVASAQAACRQPVVSHVRSAVSRSRDRRSRGVRPPSYGDWRAGTWSVRASRPRSRVAQSAASTPKPA